VAPKSDAVLMDLRGFTRKNHGCVFELTWVVQQIPLSRIVVLIDATSDYQALEETAQAAWRHLRSDSPNAGYLEPVLTSDRRLDCFGNRAVRFEFNTVLDVGYITQSLDAL
jgi:hypothetical protein